MFYNFVKIFVIPVLLGTIFSILTYDWNIHKEVEDTKVIMNYAFKHGISFQSDYLNDLYKDYLEQKSMMGI